MKLEDQVVSLELAKKLKELGVKQESLWYWYHPAIEPEDSDLVLNSRGRVLNGDFAEVQTRLSGYEIKEKYSAFTVTELGEILPPRCTTYRLEFGSFICRESNYEIQADTEANARAEMLVYLLENKLIEL